MGRRKLSNRSSKQTGQSPDGLKRSAESYSEESTIMSTGLPGGLKQGDGKLITEAELLERTSSEPNNTQSPTYTPEELEFAEDWQRYDVPFMKRKQDRWSSILIITLGIVSVLVVLVGTVLILSYDVIKSSFLMQ